MEKNVGMDILFAVACAMADAYLTPDTEDDKFTDKEYEYIREQALDRAYYKFGTTAFDEPSFYTRFAQEIADGTFKDFIETVVSDILEQREIKTYLATFRVEGTISVPIRANTDADVIAYLDDMRVNEYLFESVQSEYGRMDDNQYSLEQCTRDKSLDMLADWECLDIRNFVREE